MTTSELIKELVSIILDQDREIQKLNDKIQQVKQYIEVYEEYIKQEDSKWQR